MFTARSLAAATMVALTACADPDATQPTEFTAELQRAAPLNPATHLTGADEVPANASLAQGEAFFSLNADGSAIRYRLLVANIENTLMAHIHVAPAGVNGGIVVWLRPAGPPPQLVPGRFDGVYAEGVITAASLVGSLAGQPLSALLDAMRAGNTYVNVHTSQLPGGEIRGQIDVRGL